MTLRVVDFSVSFKSYAPTKQMIKKIVHNELKSIIHIKNWVQCTFWSVHRKHYSEKSYNKITEHSSYVVFFAESSERVFCVGVAITEFNAWIQASQNEAKAYCHYVGFLSPD